jgi:hypothetical protein
LYLPLNLSLNLPMLPPPLLPLLLPIPHPQKTVILSEAARAFASSVVEGPAFAFAVASVCSRFFPINPLKPPR